MQTTETEYESIRIKKASLTCSLCEGYAAKQSVKPVVVMSCEGGCLRGEVARQAANILCFELAPEKTARLCLGGAFTKDTGQRALVRNTSKLVAVEGCAIECASRMMKGVVPDIEPQVAIADKLCAFETRLFGIDEMPEEQIRQHAREVAAKIALTL